MTYVRFSYFFLRINIQFVYMLELSFETLIFIIITIDLYCLIDLSYNIQHSRQQVNHNPFHHRKKYSSIISAFFTNKEPVR